LTANRTACRRLSSRGDDGLQTTSVKTGLNRVLFWNTADRYVSGKADDFVVPTKLTNKTGTPAAESMVGKGSSKNSCVCFAIVPDSVPDHAARVNDHARHVEIDSSRPSLPCFSLSQHSPRVLDQHQILTQCEAASHPFPYCTTLAAILNRYQP
jgi:hypothetical protein